MDLLGSLVSAVNNTIAGPVKDYNTFMGIINNAIQDPMGSIGDVASVFGVRNPYARENTLSALQRRGEPVLAFDWLAVIIDPNPTSALPWYYIDTLTSPDLSISTQDLHFNGLTKRYAGQLNVGSVELGLFTDQNAATFTYANDWFNATYRQDGFYSLPSRYKRDVLFFVLDPQRRTIIDIRFVGCWPTNYAPYSFDGQNSVVETRLTLSVDQVIFNTESSLTRAVDRFKSQWPGLVTDAAANLLNFPTRR